MASPSIGLTRLGNYYVSVIHSITESFSWASFFVKHIFFFWKSYCICYNNTSVFCLVFWLRGTWDLSFSTRYRTCTSCIGRPSLNHWTAGEIAWILKKNNQFSVLVTTSYIGFLVLHAGLCFQAELAQASPYSTKLLCGPRQLISSTWSLCLIYNKIVVFAN